MTAELGVKPQPLAVYLTKGADFITTLTLSENYPAGTTLTLELGGGATVWTATITGADAKFDVDKAETDVVADGTTAQIRYVNGTTEQVWYSGRVYRRD